MHEKDIYALKKFAKEIRLATMYKFNAQGFCHVGGSLSIADLLVVLYGKIMDMLLNQQLAISKFRFGFDLDPRVLDQARIVLVAAVAIRDFRKSTSNT